MKKILSLLFLFTISVLCFAQKVKSNSDYSFYENKGQIVDQNGKQNSEVKYLYISNGLNVQLRKSGFSYDVYESERKEIPTSKNTFDKISQKEKPQFKTTQKFHRVDIDFVNANSNVEIVAEGKSEDYDNYYNIPKFPKGVENVHRYRKVTYKNLYPNIDLEFFKPSDTLKPVEYNFIVKPGGKISNIQLKFNGAKTELIDGKLSMKLRFGEMQENIPKSWIDDLNSKKNVSISFKQIKNQTFGFESSQDTFDKTLVIDPVPTRIWGSYFGGDNTDKVTKILADKVGDVYLAGYTYSRNSLATSGAFILTNPSTNPNIYEADGFLVKFDKDGERLYATYLNMIPWDLVCDVNNNLLIAGNTAYSPLFTNLGTPGTHKPQITKNDNSDSVILKFNTLGSRIWGTYFGGSRSEQSSRITTDALGNIILVGSTDSKDGIATTGTHSTQLGNDNSFGTTDGFIAKFNENGNLIWGTYYGGELQDFINDVKTDGKNIYIIGKTYSQKNIAYGDFALTTKSSWHGFFSKFSENGTLIFGSYYGGENLDELLNIDISDNRVLITGSTYSKTDIATPNAPYPNFIVDPNAYINGFFSIFNLDGSIVFGSYFNTEISDSQFDKFGNILLAGRTESFYKNFSTPNAYQTVPNGNQELFLTKFNKNYQKSWSTYYGGSSPESAAVVSYDSANETIYLGGVTDSDDGIATPNAFQTKKTNLYEDIFIVKFKDCVANPSVSAANSICPNSDINLQASGGATYYWTGPNNFTSSEQNPTIANAKAINSGTYYCTISGTGDCDGTFKVEVKVEDKTPPVPNIANLPDISGDCNPSVSEIPTANDACAGKIIATTSNPLQYSMPGTYIIVWDYDDGNGNITHQNQNVIISSPALPTANATQEFCATNNSKISDLQIAGQNITWYDATGTVLDPTSKLVNGDYYASQNTNGCESDKIKITVKINVTPLPAGNANQDFCASQSAKISNLKVTGTDLKFYDSAGNLLPTYTLLLDNTSYFVTQTTNSCESEKLEIKVVISQNALPANDFSLSICNETTANIKIEDLTKYQENLISNSSSYIFEYFDQNQVSITDFKSRTISIGNNNFYVKVSTKDGCFKLVKLMLQLNAKPEINLPESAEFCNGLSVELNAGFTPNYTYLWNTGEKTSKIIVNKEGTYSVKVSTPFSCESTASIVVKKSILADILKVEITNNNATIILSATGNFLYSLDNITFQTSNEFKNLNNGNYTVYVKTQQGCIIGEMKFSIFNVTNSFTPNGDGKNDTWKISGLENYPNSEVSVYDASGKRVFYKITSGSFEWDGKLNSRNLPTAAYWYTIKVSDGRILTGYLLLKNRN